MIHTKFAVLAAVAAMGMGASAFAGSLFNGAPDNQDDSHGYYYQVGGALTPNGQTRNGDASTGGSIRYISDDPIWGLPMDSWQKDSWYPSTGSIALTLKSGSTIVFDNNGIETGAVPAGYYTPAGAFGSQVVGYGMSNNFDFVYAGLFQLPTATRVTSLTGYFIVAQPGSLSNPNNVAGPFDPNDPGLAFHMNIWSEAGDGSLLPVNTGGFTGNVFSSDLTGGTFSWSKTDYVRQTSWTADIYRLTYTLNTPLTLEGGNYYFGSEATIAPATPLPSSAGMGLVVVAGMGAVAAMRKRRMVG